MLCNKGLCCKDDFKMKINLPQGIWEKLTGSASDNKLYYITLEYLIPNRPKFTTE